MKRLSLLGDSKEETNEETEGRQATNKETADARKQQQQQMQQHLQQQQQRQQQRGERQRRQQDLTRRMRIGLLMAFAAGPNSWEKASGDKDRIIVCSNSRYKIE